MIPIGVTESLEGPVHDDLVSSQPGQTFNLRIIVRLPPDVGTVRLHVPGLNAVIEVDLENLPESLPLGTTFDRCDRFDA